MGDAETPRTSHERTSHLNCVASTRTTIIIITVVSAKWRTDGGSTAVQQKAYNQRDVKLILQLSAYSSC